MGNTVTNGLQKAKPIYLRTEALYRSRNPPLLYPLSTPLVIDCSQPLNLKLSGNGQL